MRFIDLHCDTLLLLHQGGELRENSLHVDVEKLVSGDALAQCFAIFIPDNEDPRWADLAADPFAYYQRTYALYRRQLALNEDRLASAAGYRDIMENAARGKISAVLTVEDAVCLGDQLTRVDQLYTDGVRIMSFTWNHENNLGYPNSRDEYKHSLPLKPFGLACLERMERLGIIPDVSHLSEGGFDDVARHASKPFMATHSCARALCDHPRNLTDRQLKVLGEKGGVCGLNFYSAFLRKDSKETYLDDLCRHAVHIARHAGVEALAFGSDFDGIENWLEMRDYGGMPLVAARLEKYFSPCQMDKICSGNALRVFRTCTP